MRVFSQCIAFIIIHNYCDFGEKLFKLKISRFLALKISFFRRYVLIIALFRKLIQLFFTSCLVQVLLFSYANYGL